MSNDNIAYHGSSKVFQEFDLSFVGSGEGSSLLAKGINLAREPSVANHYRKIVSQPYSEMCDPIVVSPHGELDLDDARNVVEALKKLQVEKEGSIEWRKAKMVLELNGVPGDYQPEFGAVYEVRVPDISHFLVWGGGLNDQNMDIVELVRKLYDEEALEDIYDAASEECRLGAMSTFDDLFEKTLLQGVHETLDELKDAAPDFDWDRLHQVIDEHCPMIHEDTDEVGRALYSFITSIMGEEKGAEWLAKQGVHGVVASQSMVTGGKPYEVLVVWSIEELTILRKMSQDELELIGESAPSHLEMAPSGGGRYQLPTM